MGSLIRSLAVAAVSLVTLLAFGVPAGVEPADAARWKGKLSATKDPGGRVFLKVSSPRKSWRRGSVVVRQGATQGKATKLRSFKLKRKIRRSRALRFTVRPSSVARTIDVRVKKGKRITRLGSLTIDAIPQRSDNDDDNDNDDDDDNNDNGGGGPTLTVSVRGTGTGTVTSSPRGIACKSGSNKNCSKSFSGSISVRLYAKAEEGLFEGWSGGCKGDLRRDYCDISANEATSVTATFTKPVYTNPFCLGYSYEPELGYELCSHWTKTVPLPDYTKQYWLPGAKVTVEAWRPGGTLAASGNQILVRSILEITVPAPYRMTVIATVCDGEGWTCPQPASASHRVDLATGSHRLVFEDLLTTPGSPSLASTVIESSVGNRVVGADQLLIGCRGNVRGCATPVP